MKSGSNTIAVTAIGGLVPLDTTKVNVTYTYSPGTVAIAVTPLSAIVTVPMNGAGTARFAVTNTGSGTETVTMSGICTGTATGCAISGTNPIGINAGAADTATLTFTGSAAAGVGGVRLAAVVSGPPSPADTAETDVSVTGKVAHGVQLTTYNAGTVHDPGYCFDVSVHRGLAITCGDLRYVHSLPPVRTYNRRHQPSLIYQSQTAHPYLLEAAAITADTSNGSIDSVVVLLKSGGATIDRANVAGAAFAHGVTQRVLLGVDDSAAASGVVNLVVSATTYPHTGATTTDSVSGYGAIQSARNSHLGRGVLVAGLENLQFYGAGASDSLFWTTGGGNVRYYRPTSTTYLWRTDSLVERDSIQFDTTARLYTRYAPHGVRVVFDTLGRHIKTIDRLGHLTRFYYNGTAGDLNYIALPVPGDTNSAIYRYTFKYDGSGYVDTIQAPGPTGSPRIIQLIHDSGHNLIKLIDPDGSYDSLAYGAQYLGALSALRDKRGTAYKITYDSAIKVRQTVLDSLGLKVANTFVALQSRGFHNALSSDSAYGLAIDPLADSTRYWLDPYGAPAKISDPLNNVTLLTRGNSSYPGAVTRVRYANGLILGATYDGRGNIASRTDSSTNIGGSYATTTYSWDGRWDFDTLTTLPLGEYLEVHLDNATGNRLWQQDGRGSVGRISFNYAQSGCTGLLTTDSLPQNPRDSVSYDAVRCNLLGTKSPLGHWVFYVSDSVGRDTLISTPIDSADRCTSWTSCSYSRLSTQKLYDALDRDTLTKTREPAMNGGAADTAIVKNLYDAEGNRVAVVRQESPNAYNLNAIRTATVYDAIGRAVADTDVAGKVTQRVFDAAGNLTTFTTRRGFRIVSTFDKLNRVLMRSDTSVYYPSWSNAGIPNDPYINGTYNNLCSTLPDACASYGGITESGDTAKFAYDAVGHIVEADNISARVSRTYLRNGKVRSETQAVRTAQPAGGASFTTHLYNVGYHYDRDGRRDTLYYPPVFGTVVSNTAPHASYSYDASTGWLRTVVDPMGLKFTFGYMPRGDPDTLWLPQHQREVRTYDADANLIAHTVGDSSPVDYNVRNASFKYDGRGKELVAANTTGLLDTLHSQYSGKGQMVRDTAVFPYPLGRYKQAERYLFDALGFAGGDTVYEITPSSKTSAIIGNVLQPGTDRSPGEYDLVNSVLDSVWFDAAGNNQFYYQQTWLGTPLVYPSYLHDRASYYSAEDKLVEAEARVLTSPSNGANAYVTRVDERTRYDALGRRVFVSDSASCEGFNLTYPYNCRRSSVRRFAWDGNQEIAEVQVQDSTPVVEMDTGVVALAIASDKTDNNPFFGQILYTFGNVVDRPLSATRMNFADRADTLRSPLPYFVRSPISIVPLWDAHDRMDAVISPQLFETYSLTSRLTRIQLNTGWFPYSLFSSAYSPDTWHGSLLYEKLDPAGTAYRRNRVYDPFKGQFTQEDPIGLAGGLNAYGFAAGDPVSYSDPFGLKVCFGVGDIDLQRVIHAIQGATGTLFTLGGKYGKNCIDSTSIRPVGGAYTELGSFLLELVNSPMATGIDYLSNLPSIGGKGGANLGEFEVGHKYFSFDKNGRCPGDGASVWPFTAEAIAAHELGHVMAGLRGLDTADESLGMATEDLYHATAREPLRCTYQTPK